ncbi:uncharacterized protein LOC111867381 [Cryptotermes secundus]|uniref:uncharacterized protein LOC111867381 n=1 Tax=Cryptotermes secundus TaxID=105785 RepID=UPI000CD7C564|nr:uncharacterized protein LOC111867381 [Cryptotermes secundus]
MGVGRGCPPFRNINMNIANGVMEANNIIRGENGEISMLKVLGLLISSALLLHGQMCLDHDLQCCFSLVGKRTSKLPTLDICNAKQNCRYIVPLLLELTWYMVNGLVSFLTDNYYLPSNTAQLDRALGE